MSIQQLSEKNIPSQVYELAAEHEVGIPLKRQRRRFIQIFLLFVLLMSIAWLGWLGYNIYGYLAFLVLSRTYPTINSVPDNQLGNYLWLQGIHDNFWIYTLQITASYLSLLSSAFPIFAAARTKLYLCSDGLLIITRKKVEAVRWDGVKEFFTRNGKVTKLVRRDASSVELPFVLVSGRANTLNTAIIDEATKCLLPDMLSSYERGETVTFGDLEVNQKGLYRPGGMVYWRQVGDIELEKQRLSVYSCERDDDSEQERQQAPIFTWHTWSKGTLSSATWPNLPIFIALVTTLLDQRGINSMESTSFSQQTGTIHEMAMRARRRSRRKKRLLIALIIILLLGLLSLAIGIPIYQSVQQDQRVAHDTQLLQAFYTQRAHKPYAVQVPGEHCGKGKEFWLDDDSTNAYVCQPDGLLMTQNDFQYQDGEYFTFVDDALSQDEAFSSINYFPHHYRVQVQATIVSGGPSTCVSVAFHIQHFQGRQWFDICADGSWDYGRCDLQCNTDKQIASGALAQASKTYLISVDVTDHVLTLDVNSAQVTTIQDSTYMFTNQLELALSGDQYAGEPITARFSNFSYTPLS